MASPAPASMAGSTPVYGGQGLESTLGLGLSELLNPVNPSHGDMANPAAAAAPTAAASPQGDILGSLDGLDSAQRAAVLIEHQRTLQLQASLALRERELQLDAVRTRLPHGSTDNRSRTRARDQGTTDNSRPWCNADSSRVMGKEASMQLNVKGDPEYNALVFASDHPERIEFVYQHTCDEAIAKALYTNIHNAEEFHTFYTAGKPAKMGRAKDKTKLGSLDSFKCSYDGLLAKKSSAGVQAYFEAEQLDYVNINDPAVTAEAKENMKRKALAKKAEFGDWGLMAVAEVADRQSFMLAAAVMFDTATVNKTKTGFKPGARPVQLTKEQLAIVAFKINNRLSDPLLDGTNRGGSHINSMQEMLVKLEARLATMPCTTIEIISPDSESPEL